MACQLANHHDEIFKLNYLTLCMKINENLAEFMGIIIGDGNIQCSTERDKKKVYCISIAGDFSKDLDYHQNYINAIFYDLFKTSLRITNPKNNELTSRKYSKEIVLYLKSLGIPCGNKSRTCRIPEIILNSNKIMQARFIRGLADTDFCLMFKRKGKYPIIKCGFASRLLTEDIEKLLRQLGFKFGHIVKEVYFDKRTKKYQYKSRIYIYGTKNLELWMKLIGFKNNRHLEKYNLWKN